MANQVPLAIETPFEFRSSCWFCNEPAGNTPFNFPHKNIIVFDCPHPKISVPSCPECRKFAYQGKGDSIWQIRSQVKRQLIKKYQKDLAIGIHWTPEALANSQFEGGNFEGFQKSAWFMYEVARDRVNFSGWPLEAGGLKLENHLDDVTFSFDGVTYPNIEEAIVYYAKAFDLHQPYLRQVVASIGREKFAQAVRFCRLLIDATPDERRLALKNLLRHEF